MTNEELDASIQAYLNRRDTYPKKEEVKIEIASKDSTIPFFYGLYKYALPFCIFMFVISCLAGASLGRQAANSLTTFVGVLGLGYMLWRMQRICTAQHEEDMIKQEERNQKRFKKKRKILFGEEHLLDP